MVHYVLLNERLSFIFPDLTFYCRIAVWPISYMAKMFIPKMLRTKLLRTPSVFQYSGGFRRQNHAGERAVVLKAGECRPGLVLPLPGFAQPDLWAAPLILSVGIISPLPSPQCC